MDLFSWFGHLTSYTILGFIAGSIASLFFFLLIGLWRGAIWETNALEEKLRAKYGLPSLRDEVDIELHRMEDKKHLRLLNDGN